jgi:uncharacterized protein (TIGR00297 family)
MLTRFAVGAVLALIVAFVARRARALSPSGTIGAFVVGTLAVTAGWDFAGLLILFFTTSTLLSRWRSALKESRAAGVVEKGHERDFVQVVANGGVFAAAAALAVAIPASLWGIAALGALAASTADTWSTEIGIAFGGVPRSITTGKPIPRGLSGGVTFVGSAAAAVGGLVIAGGAGLFGWPWHAVVAIAGGGVSGAFTDSMLGDTVQERRRCGSCGAFTERQVHTCGGTTVRVSGRGGFGNDAVNLTSSMVGAGVAASIAAGLRP